MHWIVTRRLVFLYLKYQLTVASAALVQSSAKPRKLPGYAGNRAESTDIIMITTSSGQTQELTHVMVFLVVAVAVC